MIVVIQDDLSLTLGLAGVAQTEAVMGRRWLWIALAVVSVTGLAGPPIFWGRDGLELASWLAGIGSLVAAVAFTAVAWQSSSTGPPVDAVAGLDVGGPKQADFWYFPDQSPITIVCAELPAYLRERMSYADRDDPDYVEMYTYADPDSLLQLYAHIYAINPMSEVKYRTAPYLNHHDYTNHLVLVGGIDWNEATREFLTLLSLPVQQVVRSDQPEDAHFEVVGGSDHREFHAVLEATSEGPRLRQDVAHFYRGPNPLNSERTVTICNGMFARGVLGAARALTDIHFRGRNATYIEQRFKGHKSFSILSRVSIANGVVMTPDWTRPEDRLHEWPALGQ